MDNSIFQRFSIEKSLFFIIVFGVLITLGAVFYLFFSFSNKGITVLSPNGMEEWEIGKSYDIVWQAKGIDRVGIVLFKEKEAKWIAKDIPASVGKYQWKIYPGQEYGDGFWIAVLEYPWKEGNKIDYSNASFAITYPFLNTCESLSIDREWLYLPSNFPNLRRVFITKNSYSGNLDGFEGADKICQKEAEEQGFKGEWQAFLGGDSDKETALERLNNTTRKGDGIFVLAEPDFKLERGDTCHRFLGKNFDEFWAKVIGFQSGKLDKDFLQNLTDIWLGRFDINSKKSCLNILAYNVSSTVEKYSFTVSCQNWTNNNKFIEDYLPGVSVSSFPVCYTPQGVSIGAVAVGGFGSGLENNNYSILVGKYCDSVHKLLCVEK